MNDENHEFAINLDGDINVLSEIPLDVVTLQKLVGDLSRRLQNAHHTIEAQKMQLKNSNKLAEMFRSQVNELSNALRLETNKNFQLLRKKVVEKESEKYESNKNLSTKLQKEIRMALIDISAQRLKKEPAHIGVMRKKLEKLETCQDSQILLLRHYSTFDKMNEQLATASLDGDIDKCHQLLRQGANINQLDTAGYLPIHYAISKGYLDVTKLLIQNGADITSYLSGVNPIEIASKHGHCDIVNHLATCGGNVDDEGSCGLPPIFSAIYGNHINTVLTLINCGADINALDLNKNTSLHAAVTLPDHSSDMIHLLLRYNVNTTAINQNSLTALQLAAKLANTAAIELLTNV